MRRPGQFRRTAAAEGGRRRATPLADRRQRRSAEIRERLYRAALRLFAERGFQETTVEAITEAADVGKGTFFNHFRTKEHILAAFGGERIAAVERALDRARAARGPVLDILRDLAVGAAGQSQESPALLRAIYAAHATCAPVRAQLRERLETGREILEEIFALAQKRGEVRRDISAGELARRTQSVVLGITMIAAILADAPLAKKTEDVWEIYRVGLLPQQYKNGSKVRGTRTSQKSGGRLSPPGRQEHPRKR